MKRLLLILFFVFAAKSQAQSLNETLSQVGEVYARAYVDPLAEALGADLNTGLFHGAGFSGDLLGIDVYLGVKASAAFLQNTHKAFNLNYSGFVPIDFDLGGRTQTLTVPANFAVTNAPSIFGNDEPALAMVTVNHDTTFSTLGLMLPVSFDTTLTPRETISGLLPTDIAPFLIPQVGLGTLFGTDVMVRWLPQISVPDVGKADLFGFGIRHNLNQYLPVLPLDVAVQAVWQRVRAEDSAGAEVVDARTFAVNLAASKRIGVLTVYAGLQTERSDIEFSYVFLADEIESDPNVDPIGVNFTLRNTGKLRGIFGLGVKLGPVVVNTDISVGQMTVASAGLGFAF